MVNLVCFKLLIHNVIAHLIYSDLNTYNVISHLIYSDLNIQGAKLEYINMLPLRRTVRMTRGLDKPPAKMISNEFKGLDFVFSYSLTKLQEDAKIRSVDGKRIRSSCHCTFSGFIAYV